MMNTFTHNPAPRPAARRGNAMILVAGILVLLVVIATAYITRTQAGRLTSTAVQQSATRDNNARIIAGSIAEEIAGALFADPVDPNSFLWALPGVADSNALRLAPSPSAMRYSIDRDVLPQDGRPDFPYNFQPYQVVPFTNWPDEAAIGGPNVWPKGPGAPNSLFIDSFSGNPVGNPGFGDTRWLRDYEPQRWNVDPLNDPLIDAFKYWQHLTNISRPNNAYRIVCGISDLTATNFYGDRIAGIAADLNYPYEQWLIPFNYQPQAGLFNPGTGDAIFDGRVNFENRWWGWFRLYPQAYRGGTLWGPPPNLYNLNDLNANGIPLEPGERPQDEFVGPCPDWPDGTPRWNVSRVLADTDDDSFTDSFWFTAPTPIERGVRQIVAVSIVDNSALANLNVATRFQAGDPEFAVEPFATAGETPADLALCGQQQFIDTLGIPGNWNTGFFDCLQNWEQWKDYPPNSFPSGSGGLYGDPGTNSYWEIQWYGPDNNPNDNRWLDFLSETGVRLLDGTAHPTFPDWLMTTPERRRYWLYAASRPFSASLGLTPFTLADELELRMYHGQNYPWILSRLERAINTNFGDYAFLRSGYQYEESSAYLDRLNNPELMHDNRRKVTVYSGARNDELSPWLWWRWRLDPPLAPDIDFPQIVDDEAFANQIDEDGNGIWDAYDRFLIQARRKLDLREMSPDVIDSLGGLPLGMRYLHQRLPWVLLHILADGDERGNLWDHTAAASYFGSYTGASDDVTELRELAAAFTANILAYRDNDADAPLFDNLLTPTLEVGAIPLPQWEETEPEDLTVRYLGMERQPFLLEAFIGHAYVPEVITPPQGTLGWLNNGAPILLSTQDWDGDTNEEDVDADTIVIVQIANPYDEPVILASEDPDFPYDYQLHVFDEEPVSLSAIALAPNFAPAADLDGDGFIDYFLPPARDNFPTTMIVYSIPYPPDSGPFGDNVRNFFDVLPLDHPGVAGDYTMIADMRYDTGYTVPHWSDDRDDYDTLDDTDIDDTIRLVRVDMRPNLGDPNDDSPVVIDRLDGPDEPGQALEFLEDVVAMGDPSNMLPTWDDLGVIPPPDGTGFFPVPNEQPDPLATHYMQWRSAVRAWGRDDDYPIVPAVSDPDEVNPRYISARKKIRHPEEPPDPPGNPLFDPRGPNKFYVDGNLFSMAEDPESETGFPNWPWFTVLINGQPGGAPDYSRKPTFFDMNPPADPPVEWLYPDKGYYHSAYSLQMVQKDGDFQQIGELMNVWLYGHKLEFQETFPGVWEYVKTDETFSERIRREQEGDVYGDNDRYVNRLREGEMVGTPTTDPAIPAQYALDPQHAVPPMPAGLRLLDAFVCDGPGVNYNPNPPYNHIADYFYFSNALGFEGRLTPGLININTAPVEVLRILPQWYKLIHNNPALDLGFPLAQLFPRSTLPEALISYRERFRNDPLSGQFAYLAGPDYSDRDALETDLRGDRGIASIGELRLLTEPAIADTFIIPYGDEFRLHQDGWTIDFAADNPFELQDPDPDIKYGAYLSTDVVGYNTDIDDFVGDRVASDAEEANLLLAGASNLITTRSDVFTVYFRIRSFRQNPNTGVWDATDPEYIVDDSRYVMLVDRSEVNHPTDNAKILCLEKLPN